MTEENNQNLNFKALGFEIENLSILFGLFLILWGIIISLISNSSSLTRSSNPSFYDKVTKKYTRCRKQYKICRGYHAKSRTSKIHRQSSGFFNKK